ncbi:MAG TPA: AraC family transcriptional regulator [Polyangiaceae bacterium]|jgi:AraC-like DNA-binding protein|nr:AraC family transcriptional regulator [Polyangiaceae bacterium]
MMVSPLYTEPERTATRGPTSLTSWGLAIARALETRGCNAQELFARVGLDFSALDDPEARYPVRAESQLWRLAVEATGDPCFGLEVARHTSPTTFHALGFSLAASGSLREAFERMVRYYRLVSDGAIIGFEERDGFYRISVRSQSLLAEPALEAIDAVVAVAVRLCRSLTDRKFSPLLVELRRPPPPDPTPFLRYFRAPVTFNGKEDALTFAKAACDERIQGANPELARANDLIAAQALARWESSQLADRVRIALMNGLPNGSQSQSQVARLLGMSTRALQRRLAAESTTYGALVDDTRRQLAIAYLREGRDSITDIGYLLGFAGVASFTRAFRRWTGKAPSEYLRGR